MSDASTGAVILGASGQPISSVVNVNGARPMTGQTVAVLNWGRDQLLLGAVGGSDWITPAFGTDYGQLDAVTVPVGYWRNSQGIVFLQGAVERRNSTWVNGQVLFTLPRGYRPRSQVRRFLVWGFANGLESWGRLNIESGGNVIFRTMSNPWIAGSYVQLDNIIFPAVTE
jgi:hypothetical protein